MTLRKWRHCPPLTMILLLDPCCILCPPDSSTKRVTRWLPERKGSAWMWINLKRCVIWSRQDIWIRPLLKWEITRSGLIDWMRKRYTYLSDSYYEIWWWTPSNSISVVSERSHGSSILRKARDGSSTLASATSSYLCNDKVMLEYFNVSRVDTLK